jgi:glyoxylase-like metal-dependent hydrolase (beta-lactamase superfamily II)/8-oxo-dGTP pyrophosphatase MutT (NUDIX family)
MNQYPATPRDASAVILLNQDLTEVLWAKRNPNLKFLGGFHGFPGGKVDADDTLVEVKNAENAETSKLIACAAREIFEEVGILLVRNGEKLTKGQRASLHDDLISGRFLFSDILETWGLWIDAEDFVYTGFWTTPEFSPMRFKTRFYINICPPKQTPYAAIDELQNIEFIAPQKAVELWAKSKVLIAPPVLISLRELSENKEYLATDKHRFTQIGQDKIKYQRSKIKDQPIKNTEQSLLEKSQICDGNINYIELNSRVVCFPLRTETLPPATHTNCFIVGKQEFVVIDAASKDKREQQKLFEFVNDFIEKGYSCKEIIVSHLHPDHFGGETVLQKHLLEKFGLKIPISAHKLTAESLNGKVKIEKFIEDNEDYKLKDETGATFELKALHTPGHARGHLCFYDEEFGFLLSSDNVVGLGSVLIAPAEGNMTDYLNSLERMKNLPNLNFLCGSHGSAVADAKGKIEEYIYHRLERERQSLEAIKSGAKTSEEIAKIVYQNLNENLFPLAVKSVEAHLEKIKTGNKQIDT